MGESSGRMHVIEQLALAFVILMERERKEELLKGKRREEGKGKGTRRRKGR